MLRCLRTLVKVLRSLPAKQPLCMVGAFAATLAHGSYAYASTAGTPPPILDQYLRRRTEQDRSSAQDIELVLARGATAPILIAGHRSHRSHASHYSGASSGHRSHQSHYSAYSAPKDEESKSSSGTPTTSTSARTDAYRATQPQPPVATAATRLPASGIVTAARLLSDRFRIQLKSGQIVTLAGIRCAPGQSIEAEAELQRLLDSKSVTLRQESSNSASDPLLAYVFFSLISSTGVKTECANLELLRKGLAVADLSTGSGAAVLLQESEDEAKRSQVGTWKSDN